MPVYDYACKRCGPFTMRRPMVECDALQPCPNCGVLAARAWLTAPALGTVSSRSDAAFAASECGRDMSRPSAHASGCACCAPRFGKPAGTAADGFASKRSWNA